MRLVAFVFGFLLLVSSNLCMAAGPVWGQIKNNYIESVVVFGGGHSNVLAITLINTINTGCGASDNG